MGSRRGSSAGWLAVNAAIAANIANSFPEATGLGVNVLIASGLVLFVVTFAVNFLARAIVAKSEKGLVR